MDSTSNLIKLLTLEKIEENIFRGQNYQAPWGRVFGGQVLAQALHAAYQTVEPNRILHSLHSYFILVGDLSLPIIFTVECIRDGGSFSTRRVVAVQKGRPIFILSASFNVETAGLEHQIMMPNVPPPYSLLSDIEIAEAFKEKDPATYKRHTLPRPMEFRPVEPFDPNDNSNKAPFKHIWIKAKDQFEATFPMQQQILAYISDYNLFGTILLPHRENIIPENLFLASLDHAMWFHRPFDANQWLLYALESPSASNSRGLCKGNFFTEDGKLVATVMQEGLVKVKG